MMVCSRRAPIFSVPSFTRKAKRAISSRASRRELQLDALSLQQRRVLLGQRRLRLRQNADEIFHGERLQLHADGKASLQLRNQVARLRNVERARRDKQDVVGAHHAVARIHRRPFDDRQNVPLHAFARDVRPMAALASGDLVDLIQKNDAANLPRARPPARHLVHVDQPLLFFLHQVLEGLARPSSSASWCAGRRGRAACP